jgi:hypothetical protein
MLWPLLPWVGTVPVACRRLRDVKGGAAGAKRWVRYVMPVMVDVDCGDDKVTRVVTLPEEVREDRDDMGHFLIYDEKFVRRNGDEQPQVHAFCGRASLGASAVPGWRAGELAGDLSVGGRLRPD